MNVAKMMIMKVGMLMVFLMLCLGCMSKQAEAQSSSDDKDILLLVKWATLLCCPPGILPPIAAPGVGSASLANLRSDVKQGTIYPGIGHLTSLLYLQLLEIPGLHRRPRRPRGFSSWRHRSVRPKSDQYHKTEQIDTSLPRPQPTHQPHP